MADAIREFRYATPGRGRGVLGMVNFEPCRKPGKSVVAGSSMTSGVVCGPEQPKKEESQKRKVLIAMYNYDANEDSPGGFSELSLKKGQMVELVGKHPSNEHWWEVKNEEGEEGFVPSSYVLIKEDQTLPWLQLTALKSEEAERRERAQRLAMEKAAAAGLGFGPPPPRSSMPAKQYVSSYNRGKQSSSNSLNYYCEVCDKHLNGPKPYQAHMVSKAHNEELALRNE